MVSGRSAAGTMSEHLSTPTSRNEGVTHVRGRRGLGEHGREILARTVKHDVIPRLVAMPWAARVEVNVAAPVIGEAEVRRLVDICLESDGLAVAAHVAGLHRAGVAAEVIYTELLTPVARELGELWTDDEVNFAEVTLGMIRLQNAQRALAPDFVGPTLDGAGGPRILLMPVPGEQHTFGLSMVLDFFKRAGWDAWLGVVGTDREAATLVGRERADVVGLSFACNERIEMAARLIADFRRVAENKRLFVIVGGPAFVADPSLAGQIGADGTALDGHQAVLLAHEMLQRPVQAAMP